MCEKKKFQGNYNTYNNYNTFPCENFPRQITLFIILPTYLFINLFCFKYLVANKFFQIFNW